LLGSLFSHLLRTFSLVPPVHCHPTFFSLFSLSLINPLRKIGFGENSATQPHRWCGSPFVSLPSSESPQTSHAFPLIDHSPSDSNPIVFRSFSFPSSISSVQTMSHSPGEHFWLFFCWN
jgi:hypothetical protein